MTTHPLKKLALLTSDLSLSGLLSLKKVSIPVGPPREVRAILLVALGHMGDALLFSYMLPALRGRFPDAVIDVLTGTYCAPIFTHNRYVRRVVCFDHLRLNRARIGIRRKLSTHVSTYRRAIRALREAPYDISVDPRLHYPNGNLMTYLGRVRHKIGIGSGGFGSLLDVELRLPDQRAFHYTEIMERCLAACGVSARGSLRPYFPTGGDSKPAGLIECLENRKFALILPESGDTAKMLNWRFWDQISEFLLKQTTWRMVIGGIDADTSKWAAQLRDRHVGDAGRIVDAVGHLRLADLYDLGRRAIVSITVDSLPAHLCAVDGDTISLFKNGSGSLYLPIGKKSVTVFHDDVASRDLIHPTPTCTSIFFPSVESEGVLRAVDRRILELARDHAIRCHSHTE